MYCHYPWPNPGVAIPSQNVFFDVPFFLLRTAGYFVIWIGLSYFLNRWSSEQDREARPRVWPRFRNLSALGLVLYGLTITFAAIDWVMSLEPRWYSTIYPVLFATGQ